MGNLISLRTLIKKPCVRLSRNRRSINIFQISDGKIVEFTAPLPVKELLMKFESRFVVTSSRKFSDNNNLPPNFELQLGKTYYLHPCNKATDHHVTTDVKAAEPEPEPKPEPEPEPNGVSSVKRIKVVITKKQLQELLSNKTSFEKIILGVDKTCSSSVGASTNRNCLKPRLAPIPEENEFE
ncbi:hypothetical protein ABFX02_06G016300 [Erythranthe guttata]